MRSASGGADVADMMPAIDLAAALERAMGDRGLLQRVLARFAVDYRDVVARLRAALDAGDGVLAQRIAHTLKGAASMIDAGGLRQLAQEVESAIKGGNGAPPASIDALDAELTRVLEKVDMLLATSMAPPPVAPTAAMPAAAATPIDEQDLARLRAMLDIGDGRAPDLVRQWHPHLLATLGQDRMHTLDSAIGRFDFERALALLEEQDAREDAQEEGRKMEQEAGATGR